jgi:hypothetical protein
VVVVGPFFDEAFAELFEGQCEVEQIAVDNGEENGTLYRGKAPSGLVRVEFTGYGGGFGIHKPSRSNRKYE